MQAAESVKRCVEYWVSAVFGVECSVAFAMQEKPMTIMAQDEMVMNGERFPAMALISLNNRVLVDPADMHDAMRDIYMYMKKRGEEYENSL
jgi:hypothetical protein